MSSPLHLHQLNILIHIFQRSEPQLVGEKQQLTTEDIKGIFSRTCSHYNPFLSYSNNGYGYGEIDVYHGQSDILGINGIEGLPPSQSSAVNIYPTSDGNVKIDFKSVPTKAFTVKFYFTSGVLVQHKIHSGLSTFYTISLPHGIYAVQLNGCDVSTTGSSLIRR